MAAGLTAGLTPRLAVRHKQRCLQALAVVTMFISVFSGLNPLPRGWSPGSRAKLKLYVCGTLVLKKASFSVSKVKPPPLSQTAPHVAFGDGSRSGGEGAVMGCAHEPRA